MAKFLTALWRVITFPFVLLFHILVFPFRVIHRIRQFLNDEPEDRPLMDTFSSLAAEEQARESFWGHIEALRAHLLRIVLALAAGVGISFAFTVSLMEYLAIPVGGLDNLQAIEVTEELGVFMRVALTSGIAIMLPYIAFELWLFAAPGLRSKERKFSLLGIPSATILFLGGMAFTYYVLLPAALPFLGSFTDISQFWTARDYFGFVTGLMLWIGLFFEFPLVIYILTSVGFVNPRVLAQQWRLAIVIIAIMAAAVTPTIDPVNMALVMLPMSLLYFVSIGLSYIAYAGRRKADWSQSIPEGEQSAQQEKNSV
ncbi:MAG TPA: twin-arginine translocase subunit TatC [Anaerolineales bacterium]|nr:twin-arginine translocase subunit TatC [Anaerolineales bacterium]